MSTTAFIGIVLPKSSPHQIEFIEIDYDGYPSYIGPRLKRLFNTKASATKLIRANGEGKFIDGPLDFFSADEFGKKKYKPYTFKTFRDLVRNCDFHDPDMPEDYHCAKYVYLFYRSEWYMYSFVNARQKIYTEIIDGKVFSKITKFK
jgi:hypothetical protein